MSSEWEPGSSDTWLRLCQRVNSPEEASPSGALALSHLASPSSHLAVDGYGTHERESLSVWCSRGSLARTGYRPGYRPRPT